MKVIEVLSPSNQVMYIEVDDQAVAKVNPSQAPGGGEQASFGSKAQTMIEEMEKIGEVIAGVCDAVQGKVTQAFKASVPGELTLEFGVKLAGEAGVPLVTKGTVEGTFKVTAKWDFAAKQTAAIALATPGTTTPPPGKP